MPSRPDQRGLALGTNQIAAIAGQFVGLIAGGLLAAIDWRAVFWVNVPVGVFGTVWAYRKLRETAERHPASIDWWGNVTFAVGLGAVLIAITYGIQPYGGHTMGWTNPWVLGGLIGGRPAAGRVRGHRAPGGRADVPARPVPHPRLRGGQRRRVHRRRRPRRPAVHAHHLAAGHLAAAARLQLRRHAAVGGHLPAPAHAGLPGRSGPISGYLSDRFGSRGFATAGMLVFGASFVGLLLLPVDFSYWAFALLILINGIGVGMFAAPNSSSIMGSVPRSQRGAASGMRSTFQNSGTALSIGVFFSLMIAGLATNLPHTLTAGLVHQGVPHAVAHQVGALPPVSSLFAAVLGVNPVSHLLQSTHVLSTLPAANQGVLTGHQFFPHLISGPFHDGLVVVFIVAAGLSVLGALASLHARRPLRADPRLHPPTERSHPMTDTTPTIDPHRTALLVMDYQQAIVGMIDDSEALVARAAQAIELVRSRGGHVGYVRVAFTAADLENIPPTSSMGARIASSPQGFMDDAPTHARSTSAWRRATATSSCARRASAPSPPPTSPTSSPSAASTPSSSRASAPAASSSPPFATAPTATTRCTCSPTPPPTATSRCTTA